MIYALNLAEDGRILSVTYEKYAPSDAVLVEELPEGNVADYRFVVVPAEELPEDDVVVDEMPEDDAVDHHPVKGEFIYDPLPEPEHPEAEPTANDILNALLGVTE